MMKTRFAKISKDSENYMQYLENKSYSVYDELADSFIANNFAIQISQQEETEEVKEQEEVSYNIEDKLSLEGIEINELKIETQDLKITTKKPKKEKSKKSTNE